MKKIEENVIKDVRNLLRLKQEIDDTTVKNIRNLFILQKGDKAIKKRIIRDIRNLFEDKKEDYYRLVKEIIFWCNNYIEYESNGDRNKTLSAEEYFNKIRSWVKDIINNLQNYNNRKIELTIATNFISSKDNDEELIIHSKRDNIKIKINDKAHEVIEIFFGSFFNRYQIGFEISMRISDFIFDCVHLLHCKCHRNVFWTRWTIYRFPWLDKKLKSNNKDNKG